jgi:hypothetical protein
MRGFDGKMREGARKRTEIDSGDCGICYAVRSAAQNMDLKASGMRCGVVVKGKGWGMIASSHARAAAVAGSGTPSSVHVAPAPRKAATSAAAACRCCCCVQRNAHDDDGWRRWRRGREAACVQGKRGSQFVKVRCWGGHDARD